MTEPVVEGKIWRDDALFWILRGDDGGSIFRRLAGLWDGPAALTVELPVDQAPAECRACIIAWLAYPENARLARRRQAMAALLADALHASIDADPGLREMLPPWARIRRRDRERRVDTATNFANERIRMTAAFAWPQIPWLKEPKSIHQIAVGISERRPRKLPRRSPDPQSMVDTLRHRGWRAGQHVAHLAIAASLRGLPEDSAGLRSLLEAAEFWRLTVLPMLRAGIPATESVKFLPKN